MNLIGSNDGISPRHPPTPSGIRIPHRELLDFLSPLTSKLKTIAITLNGLRFLAACRLALLVGYRRTGVHRPAGPGGSSGEMAGQKEITARPAISPRPSLARISGASSSRKI